MNLVLTRTSYSVDGIFGILLDENASLICFTLEHAYESISGYSYFPKVPKGVYDCRRGEHHLGPMGTAIETFEVMNVPGHSGILLHPGNTEVSSEGCILLGQEIQGSMITNSRITFEKFMSLQDGVDSFQLIIK